MSNKITLEVSDTAVRIAEKGCKVVIPLEQLYTAVKPAFARRHLRMMLEEIAVSEATIAAIMEEETVGQEWISAVENNETILECLRMAAEIVADKAEHEVNGNEKK